MNLTSLKEFMNEHYVEKIDEGSEKYLNIENYILKIISKNPDYFGYEKSRRSDSIYFKIYTSANVYEKYWLATIRFSDHRHPTTGQGFESFEEWNSMDYDEFKKQVKVYVIKYVSGNTYYGDMSVKEVKALLNKIIK